MRKLLCTLLILLPLLSLATKYYPGTATKNDGTVITGYFQFPDHSAIKKVKYKESLDGKKLKLKSKDLKTLEITNKNDILIRYERKYSKGRSLFNKTIKRSKKAYWFKVLQKNDDNISLYSSEFISSNASGQFASKSYTSYTYMLLPGDEDVIMLELSNATGTNIKIGFYKAFNNTIEYYLKDICPEIQAHLTKELYKEKGVLLLPELYNQYCK
jgi:hypothetical protein